MSSITVVANVDVALAPHIEELKRTRQLSGLINRLLIEHFKSESLAKITEDLITIRTEADIDDYLNSLLSKNPTANKYGLKVLKENLLKELIEGEFIIDINSGNRKKVFKKDG